MKIAIVTDAWFPQVNSVVTTLDSNRQATAGMGARGCAILNDNIEIAITRALSLDSMNCRDYALECSWQACTSQFLSCLVPNRNPN